MAHINEHFRAGYYRTNKNGTVSYISGTTVRAHESSEWRAPKSSYHSGGSSSYYSWDKPERYREDNYFGGSTSYSYSPKTGKTVVEENDGYRVVSRTEEYGNTIPWRNRW